MQIQNYCHQSISELARDENRENKKKARGESRGQSEKRRRVTETFIRHQIEISRVRFFFPLQEIVSEAREHSSRGRAKEDSALKSIRSRSRHGALPSFSLQFHDDDCLVWRLGSWSIVCSPPLERAIRVLRSPNWVGLRFGLRCFGDAIRVGRLACA